MHGSNGGIGETCRKATRPDPTHLRRDLVWLARLTDEALRRRVVADWQAKLAALSKSVYDEDERAMLAEAQKALT